MNDGKVVSADELKRRVTERFENTQGVSAFLKRIDDTPPAKDVEAVKEGVWLYTEAEGGLKYWLCSSCRSAWWRKPPHDMKRCYYCGSRMRMDS